MKNLLKFLVFLFFLSSLNLAIGQRIKDESLWLKYVQLPVKKLPSDYMTYTVNAGGQALVKSGYSQREYTSKFRMDGFKRINAIGEGAGHLRLNVYPGYLNAAQPEFKSEIKKTKSKDGKETSTTYYYYQYAFANVTEYKLFDPEGVILDSGSIPYEKIYDGTHGTSSEAVKKKRNKEYNEYEREFALASVNNAQSTINSNIRRNFDFTFEKDRQELFIIFKHASEDQYRKHYEKVKTVFAEASYTTSSEELLEKLTPSIEFYQKQAAKNPRGDKKLKRIYRAANYNLAIIYFYTDQFDKTLEHCENVIVSEKKDAKSKRLMDKVAKQRLRMETHGINTLHYYRDVESALPPNKIEALEAEREEIMEESITTQGIVRKGRDIIVGTFTLDKTADEMVFGDGGNVRFMVEYDREMKELDLLDQDVTEFEIADRKFKKIRFAPSAKGKQDASLQILEEIYSSMQIKLYKYYPSSGALSDEKAEFAFKRSNQEYPISLESTQFLIWKKGLAAYFGDCPDLSDMCKEGEIKKNKEDLIKACRIYTEVCLKVIKP